MAVNPRAVASWGLQAEAGGGPTQVIGEMEITMAAAEPLILALDVAEISLELRDGQ